MKSIRITFIPLIISFFYSSLLSQSWEVTIGLGPGDAKNETNLDAFSFIGTERINDTLGLRFCRGLEIVDGVNYSDGFNAFVGARRNFKPTKNNFRMQTGLKLNYSTLRFEDWIFSVDELKYQALDTIALSAPSPPPPLPSPENSDIPCDTIVESFPALRTSRHYEAVDISIDVGFGKGFHDNKVWINLGGSFLYSVQRQVTIPYSVIVVDNFNSSDDFLACRYVNRFSKTDDGTEPINFLGYLNMQLYPIPSLGFEAGVRTYVSNIFTTEVNYTARPTYGYIAVNYKFGQRKKKEKG